MFVYDAYVKCDVGRVRDNNEDNYYLNGSFRKEASINTVSDGTRTDRDEALFAVFDGMGGASYGEVASMLAARGVRPYPLSEVRGGAVHDLISISHKIRDDMSSRHVSHMGSTASLIYLDGGHAVICNVGDSPIYMLRGGSLRKLSIDHDMASEEVRMGRMTPEEAAVSNKRHILTQYLGVDPEEFEIEPFFADDIALQTGDRFLICSDGVSDMINDASIAECLRTARSSKDAAEMIVDRSLKAGGKDNTTAMVIDICTDGTNLNTRNKPAGRWLLPVTATAFMLLGLGIGVLIGKHTYSDKAVLETSDDSYVTPMDVAADTSDIQDSVQNAIETDGLSSEGNIKIAESFAGGSGTEEDPYMISNKEELRRLAELINSKDREYVAANYILTEDIVINETDGIDSWDEQPPEYMWTVIGNGDGFASFAGHFDGQNHSVSGLYYKGQGIITGESRYAAGLFGLLSGDALIENLVLKDSYIYADASSECGIGGIAGGTDGLSNTTIRNCENYANVSASSGRVGGIIGRADRGSIIEECDNQGNIFVSDLSGSAGGINGEFGGYKLTDCNNFGKITSDDGNAGGVTGYVTITSYTKPNIKNVDGSDYDPGYGDNITSGECHIKGLYNGGEVSRTIGHSPATSFVGGVIGNLNSGSGYLIAEELINDGSVICCDAYYGGVIGNVEAHKFGDETAEIIIKNAQNNASINAEQESSLAAGITGYVLTQDASVVRFENCLNNGDLSGGVGGVISTAVVYGGASLELVECKNTGDLSVTGSGETGGIISLLTSSRSSKGTPNHVSIQKCANSGLISGRCAAMGGIIGMAEMMDVEGSEFAVSDCENTGDIEIDHLTDSSLGFPEYFSGIIGWLGTTKEGAYDISNNSNTGNMIIKADDATKEELADEIKYYQCASIIGLDADNAILKDNVVGGMLRINGIGFETELKETSMTIETTDFDKIEQEKKEQEKNKKR